MDSLFPNSNVGSTVRRSDYSPPFRFRSLRCHVLSCALVDCSSILVYIMKHSSWFLLAAQGCVGVYFGIRWLSRNIMYMSTSIYVEVRSSFHCIAKPCSSSRCDTLAEPHSFACVVQRSDYCYKCIVDPYRTCPDPGKAQSWIRLP